MKERKTYHHLLSLLLVGATILLAACTSEDSDELTTTGSTLHVVPYIASYNHTHYTTRAVTDGYSPYTPDHDLSIGLFLLPDENPTAKSIRYSNGEWFSKVAVHNDIHYSIFGYMPKTEHITPSIVQGQNEDEGKYTLTLAGIDAITTEDVCILTGIKDMTGDLLQGNFSYTGKEDNNFVRLMMAHLLTAVDFHVTVDEGYAQLRTIKLKTMTLTTTAEKFSAAVTLTPNTFGADPITAVSYPTTGSQYTFTLFDNADGEELSTTVAIDFNCYFAPTLKDALTLVSTYDVYDKDGVMIRENCTATNKLPDLGTARGQKVTLNLKVNPTYIHVLSEKPDLNNPTINIER